MIANAVAKAPIEPLTGVRKAAMLLILLGDKVSAEMVKQLSEDEVQLVSREVARLEAISSEDAEVLLEEFYQMTMAHDFVVRGGMDYARKMLITAFGPDVAKKLIDRLSKALGGDYANLDILQKADPQQLAKFIHNEHPQTIALVLSHLNASQAAGLLVSLPPEMRSDVALRMANLDQISPKSSTKSPRSSVRNFRRSANSAANRMAAYEPCRRCSTASIPAAVRKFSTSSSVTTRIWSRRSAT